MAIIDQGHPTTLEMLMEEFETSKGRFKIELETKQLIHLSEKSISPNTPQSDVEAHLDFKVATFQNIIKAYQQIDLEIFYARLFNILFSIDKKSKEFEFYEKIYNVILASHRGKKIQEEKYWEEEGLLISDNVCANLLLFHDAAFNNSLSVKDSEGHYDFPQIPSDVDLLPGELNLIRRTDFYLESCKYRNPLETVIMVSGASLSMVLISAIFSWRQYIKIRGEKALNAQREELFKIINKKLEKQEPENFEIIAGVAMATLTIGQVHFQANPKINVKAAGAEASYEEK